MEVVCAEEGGEAATDLALRLPLEGLGAGGVGGVRERGELDGLGLLQRRHFGLELRLGHLQLVERELQARGGGGGSRSTGQHVI